MNPPQRIGMFLGTFPVISETFILRQITGLMDLGCTVDICADVRGDCVDRVHPEVHRYNLLAHATWTDAPPASVPFEMPAWPLKGETWTPGESLPLSNLGRVLRALPEGLQCFGSRPSLATKLLDVAEYGFRAASLSGLYRMARLLRLNQPCDIAHAHFGPVGNSFRFVRELWNAPLVVSFHGYDFTTVPRRDGSKVYERLFQTADLVTANSQFTRGRLIALGCPEPKIRQLSVGLDLSQFAFHERSLRSTDTVRVLSVGRLVEIKGHEYLIRALAQLRSKNPNVRCDIVGDGPLRGKLTRLIAELDLQDAVTLHGALEGPGVQRLLSDAHLFVLPSVSIEGDAEGQGLALQEAQACGLPVVATRHGALPEGFSAGDSGFLVPERDATALANQLQTLVAQHERWPQMGRAGRKFVEARYDIRQLNPALLEIYSEACEAYRSGAQRGDQQ
jgi:colanic acid/amylovoran biosynthesis glycosyltransferase